IAAARTLIPVWLVVGMYFLHWHDVIEGSLAGLRNLSDVFSLIRMPDIFAGTLPAFLTWAGLWWSQYPADRALREQNLLLQLERDIPVHAPPSFWSYFAAHIRLQLLFIFAPIFLLIGVRDVATVIWFAVMHRPFPDAVYLTVAIGSFAGVV